MPKQGKSLALILKHVESHSQACYDGISVLLCLRIITAYQEKLREQNIPCLESFYKRLQDMLWPRFTLIVELNAESVQNCDPSKLGSVDTRPHYVVRRYAEYSGAFLSINEGIASQRVSDGLALLREQVGLVGAVCRLVLFSLSPSLLDPIQPAPFSPETSFCAWQPSFRGARSS